MAFTFFTLGGRQLWEDVFFSAKWRIQRNCMTKKYRLLDNWNIRRASGTYDVCCHAFNRYVKIFQLSSDKRRAVIMLHGLTGYKEQFNKIAKMCESLNLCAITVNYPSTRKSLKSHVRQLSFFMNNLKNIEEVCFITEGIGSIIVRELVNVDDKWKKKIKISQIIQINPVNQGCKLWEKATKSKFLTFIFGVLLYYGKKENINRIPIFPKNIKLGIIYSQNHIWSLIRKLLPTKLNTVLFQESDTFLPNTSDTKSIKTWRINPLYSKSIISCCKNFIRTNKF